MNFGTESMALLDYIAARVLVFEQARCGHPPSRDDGWQTSVAGERRDFDCAAPTDPLAEPLRESLSPEVFSRFEPTSVSSYSSF